MIPIFSSPSPPEAGRAFITKTATRGWHWRVININKTTQDLFAEGFGDTREAALAAAERMMRRWAPLAMPVAVPVQPSYSERRRIAAAAKQR
jgi:hypothetical protein